MTSARALDTALRLLLLPLLAALGLVVGALAVSLIASEGVRGYGGAPSVLLAVTGFLSLLAAPACAVLLSSKKGRSSAAQQLALGLTAALLALWLAASIVGEFRLGSYEQWVQYLFVREQRVSRALRAVAWTAFAIAVLVVVTLVALAVCTGANSTSQQDPEKRGSIVGDAAQARGPSIGSARSGGLGGAWEVVDFDDAAAPTDGPAAEQEAAQSRGPRGWKTRRAGRNAGTAIPPAPSQAPPSGALPPLPPHAKAPSTAANTTADDSTDIAPSPSISASASMGPSVSASASTNRPEPPLTPDAEVLANAGPGGRRMSVLRLPQSLRTLAGGGQQSSTQPGRLEPNPHMQAQTKGGSAPHSPELLPY